MRADPTSAPPPRGRVLALLVEPEGEGPPRVARRAHLTSAQAETLVLAARGMPQKAIAGMLGVKLSTIGSRLQAARRALSLHRAEVALAYSRRTATEEAVVLVKLSPEKLELPRVLSAAEADVLRLVFSGASNHEVARERQRAPRTVANQLASIYRKLGVGSRAELFALAPRWAAPALLPSDHEALCT